MVKRINRNTNNRNTKQTETNWSNIMSLEARIAELNDNIKALISVMQSNTGAVIAEPVKQEKATPAKKAAAKSVEPKEQAGASSTDGDDAVTAKEEASTTAPSIALQDVIDVTLALGKAGKRNALVELLGKYDVPKSSALPAEKYSEFHAAATKLLEG